MSWVQWSLGSKISPAVLLIIVLVAVVLFASALVHLLVRYLSKPRSTNFRDFPDSPAASGGAAYQRQLQQLFHLHDAGLDQAFIDALPVFPYEDIVTGSSAEPFDCAVCLCEFREHDRLRLLPSCSHAFHVECIDTWLLSSSSCPLCRGVISSSGVSFENPFFHFENSGDGGGGVSGTSVEGEVGNGGAISGRRVFSVRLGKFRNVNSNCSNNNENNGGNREIGVGESSSFNGTGDLDARRCFSMGSFQYVVADLDLQVAALCSGGGGGRGRGQNCNFTFGDGVVSGGEVEGKRIYSGGKGESFSVSKIWLWSKKGKDEFPSLP